VDLSAYLRPTDFLDFHHPAIAALVAEVGPGTERERAVRLFLRVRDDVRYDPYGITLDPAAFTASHTLEAKRGYCVTKAILYAATLRAIGVPSRLGFADVVNHLATSRLLELMKTDVFSFHGYAEAWLGGRWVKATPAFNATLCEKFGTDPLEFDGVHDAILQPVTRSGGRFMDYVKDRGTFDDFKMEALIDAWREVYPHFFAEQPGSPAGSGGNADPPLPAPAETPKGDFEAEAITERNRETSR